MNFNVCVAVMFICVTMVAARYHGNDKRVLLSKRLLISAQNAGEAQMTGGQDYNTAERLEFIEDALMWLVGDFGDELTTDQLLAFVRVFAFLDKLAAEAESMSTETTAEEPTSSEEASTEETATEGVSDEETTTEGVSTEEATTQEASVEETTTEEASVEETTTEEASVEETTEENETTPNTSDMERRLVKSLLMKLVQKKLNSLN